MINGMIFDVDGVILDSMELWDNVPVWYLQKHHRKAEENLGRKMFEMTLYEGAFYLQEQYLPELEIDEILAGIKETVFEYYKNDVQMKPEMEDVLCWLHKQNIPMVVATSTAKESILAAFERMHISMYFQRVLTCEEVGAGKNEPDIYVQAQQQMGTIPETTLVIEDSLFAIRTAKKAGFQVLGVYDKESESDQAEIQMLADYYAKSFSVNLISQIMKE